MCAVVCFGKEQSGFDYYCNYLLLPFIMDGVCTVDFDTIILVLWRSFSDEEPKHKRRENTSQE